jgi:hypothetical protein
MNLRRNEILSCELVSPSSGYGPMLGSYDHGNDLSGSIKGREFFE